MGLDWARRVRDLAARIEAEGGEAGRHAELVRMVGLIEATHPFDLDRAAMSLLMEVPAVGQAMRDAGHVADAREHGIGDRLAVWSAALADRKARGTLCGLFRHALDAVLEAKAEDRWGFESFGHEALARLRAGEPGTDPSLAP